jgi:hypothetical protein
MKISLQSGQCYVDYRSIDKRHARSKNRRNQHPWPVPWLHPTASSTGSRFLTRSFDRHRHSRIDIRSSTLTFYTHARPRPRPVKFQTDSQADVGGKAPAKPTSASSRSTTPNKAVNERIGDNSLIEKARKSQSAAITCPSSRFFGNLDYFPGCRDPGSMQQRQGRTADHFCYFDL